MKHARQDYDRIQDPAGLIPSDEPVFLIRAQDRLAAETAAFYASRCRDEGLDDIAVLVENHVEAMRNWPKKKMPDLPDSNGDRA